MPLAKRYPWFSQPPAGTPIDFSIAAWSSVLLPSSSGGFVDCVSASRELTYSAITSGIRALGRTVSNVSTGTGYVIAPGACQGQKMSRLAVVYVNSLATSNVISESRSTNNSGGAQWRITSGGELYLVKDFVAGVGQSSGAGIVVDRSYVVGMTYDGNEVCFFVNGKYVGGASSAQTFSIDASASLFRSPYTSGSTDNFNGEIGLHADCIYALPKPLMMKLTDNPWQIFQP